MKPAHEIKQGSPLLCTLIAQVAGHVRVVLKERLEPYKYPRLIEFLPELPKTATGKIQRFRLREREQRA